MARITASDGTPWAYVARVDDGVMLEMHPASAIVVQPGEARKFGQAILDAAEDRMPEEPVYELVTEEELVP